MSVAPASRPPTSQQLLPRSFLFPISVADMGSWENTLCASNVSTHDAAIALRSEWHVCSSQHSIEDHVCHIGLPQHSTGSNVRSAKTPLSRCLDARQGAAVPMVVGGWLVNVVGWLQTPLPLPRAKPRFVLTSWVSYRPQSVPGRTSCWLSASTIISIYSSAYLPRKPMS